MNHVESLIRQYVELEKKLEKEQEETLGFSRYRQPVQNMAGLQCLATITAQDIDNIVKPFLYDWGTMRRVLGGSKWQSKIVPSLVKEISSNADSLENLRKKDLANMDLAQFQSVIENLYESFRGVVGKVGATKTLHLICCHSLPPWDNYIGAGVSEELKRRGVKIKAWSKPKSGEDYYRFVEQIQIWLIRYEKVLSDLAKECRGTHLGVLDAYLWWATRRPFFLL